nr:immunoglobulin light chain junction region [Macaca mulatta]
DYYCQSYDVRLSAVLF